MEAAQVLISTQSEVKTPGVFYLNADDLNSDEILGQVLKFQSSFEPGTVYRKLTRMVSPQFRNSLSLSNSPELDKIISPLQEKINKHGHLIEKKLGIPQFKWGKNEVFCACYGDGCFFKKHQDVIGEVPLRRKFTWIYYFHSKPKQFTGGDLIIFSPNGGMITVEPHAGTFVVFRSDLQHEVTPVHVPTGDFIHSRFTITGIVSEAPNLKSYIIFYGRKFWRALPIPQQWKRGIMSKLRKFVR